MFFTSSARIGIKVGSWLNYFIILKGDKQQVRTMQLFAIVFTFTSTFAVPYGRKNYYETTYESTYNDVNDVDQYHDMANRWHSSTLKTWDTWTSWHSEEASWSSNGNWDWGYGDDDATKFDSWTVDLWKSWNTDNSVDNSWGSGYLE